VLHFFGFFFYFFGFFFYFFGFFLLFRIFFYFFAFFSVFFLFFRVFVRIFFYFSDFIFSDFFRCENVTLFWPSKLKISCSNKTSILFSMTQKYSWSEHLLQSTAFFDIWKCFFGKLVLLELGLYCYLKTIQCLLQAKQPNLHCISAWDPFLTHRHH